MTELIGIAGSLRQGSFNAALLRAAAALMPDGSRLTIKSIEDIPLYNADLEKAEGVPDAVEALKDAIAASDGLLFATPEYNNSLPGVLKNAIDWLSRPPSHIKRVFHGRPVALIGASAGGFGTILSQNAWLPVFRTLRADFWSEGRLLVSHAFQHEDGGSAIVFEVAPTKVLAFAKGRFAQTRYRFPADA